MPRLFFPQEEKIALNQAVLSPGGKALLTPGESFDRRGASYTGYFYHCMVIHESFSEYIYIYRVN